MTSNETSRGDDFKALLRAIGVRGGDVVSLGTIAHTVDSDGREDDRYHGRAYRASDAVRVAGGWSGRDGYFSVSVLSPEVLASKRRRVSDVVGVRALYADLDFKGGGLETMDEAREVVKRLSKILGTPPAAVVLSGGGVQPYWRLEQGDETRFDAGDEGTAARAAVSALYRRWGRLVGSVIDVVTNGRVSKADTVWDLARILRVPGTSNMKYDPPRAVELTRVNDTASAVSLTRVRQICDEFGIVELESDSEVLGQVVSVPDEWTWAAPGDECRYVISMVEGWKTAAPSARHPWLFGQATRIAAARRLGYVTQEQWDDALEVLWTRFEELLDRLGDARGVQSGDREWLSFGVRKASAMDVDRAVSEMGGLEDDGHRHGDSDDPFAAGASCVKPKPPAGIDSIVGSVGGTGSAGGAGGAGGASRNGHGSDGASGGIGGDDDPFSERSTGLSDGAGNNGNNGSTDDPPKRSGSAKGEASDSIDDVETVDDRIDTDWKAGQFTDRWLAEAFSYQVCRQRFCWSASDGWFCWDGRRWARCPDERVVESVGRWARDKLAALVKSGTTAGAVFDAWKAVLTTKRQTDITKLTRGICEVDGAMFDQDPDLLNCLNGVVNLRTGTVMEHSPTRMITKICGAEYRPGAVHEDWDTVLTALPDDVREWVQIRYGQALTGYMTPDDRLIIQHGGGENGKSVFTSAVGRAMGGYFGLLSDRVLMSNPSDHPTELMDLRGLRLALIEETPEARRLNVQRLKKTIGTSQVTARRIRQDDVTFDATHSMFLSTNYKPSIEESDHGVWRRVLLVTFPYRFRKPGEPLEGQWDRRGDPGLRERMAMGRDGRYEAVLAWLVDGAQKHYAAGGVMPAVPERVLEETRDWQRESDVVMGYIDDRLEFSRDHHVTVGDLAADLNMWLEIHGHKAWSSKLIRSRLAGHELFRQNSIEHRKVNKGQQGIGELSRPSNEEMWGHLKAIPSTYRAWIGACFTDPKSPDGGVGNGDSEDPFA